jgi:hypothetical protein
MTASPTIESTRRPSAPPEATVEAADESKAVLQEHLAAIRQRALESRTPAQMARRLGRDPQWLADLLYARSGIRLSGGASHGNTYSGRDLEVFDTATKEHLFDVVVETVGAEKLVAGAPGGRPDWWATPGGKLFESVVGLADISVGHDTLDRQPIPLWQSRILWLGLFWSALMCAALVGVPLLWVWRNSYMGWREGSKSTPRAAVALGIILTAVVLLVGVASGVRSPAAG